MDSQSTASSEINPETFNAQYKLTWLEVRKLRKLNATAAACSKGFEIASMAFADKHQQCIQAKEDFFKMLAVKLGASHIEAMQEAGIGIAIKEGKDGVIAKPIKLERAKPQEVKQKK